MFMSVIARVLWLAVWLDSSEFTHKTVNHSKIYVQDGVHVSGWGERLVAGQARNHGCLSQSL
jgi:hypothetical protein